MRRRYWRGYRWEHYSVSISFRIVGILLLVGLVAWVTATLVFGLGRQSIPELLGMGSGFEGNVQLPVETIKTVLEEARQRMLSIADFGGWLRFSGDVASWLSFAATAVITLIAGFYGRTPSQDKPERQRTAPAQDAAVAHTVPDTQGLPASSVRSIAFLAALAAVLTAFGSLAATRSQDYFKRAHELRDQIVQARAQVIDAKTAEAAQAVLDDLDLKVRQ
jgi:hypothetical protein